MKDKIFVTFLCATLCVVTNAMGAVGDGVGTCKVQTVPEGVVRSANAQYYDSYYTYVDVWVDGAYIFMPNNGVLQCGGGYCDDGVEFNVLGEDYIFRCTVTDGTGEWQHVTWGEIPFCDGSEINVLGIENAVYSIDPKAREFSDLFHGAGFSIDTKGFCVFSYCDEDYYDFVDQKCQPKGQSAKGSGDGSGSSTDNNDIETLGKLLDAETEKFERSKWRDAEGKFNTSRLASDSIAGVVLGTAGGLISSKVIKKKQVENGFEDIKCTIGSQEVADWGDEFQVGIQ